MGLPRKLSNQVLDYSRGRQSRDEIAIPACSTIAAGAMTEAGNDNIQMACAHKKKYVVEVLVSLEAPAAMDLAMVL